MPDSTPSDANHVLDAREIDGEPFDAIMGALDDLPEDEQLLLVNSFEPVPLYGVLEGKGFTHDTEEVDEDEWHILIEHAE